MASKWNTFRAAILLLCCVTFSQGICYGTLNDRTSQRTLSVRTLRSMARAYMAYGQYDKARVLAERAVEQSRRDGSDIGEQAISLIDLGTAYSYEQRLQDAAVVLNEGVVLQKEAIGCRHPYTAHTLRMLGDVYRRQGGLEAAEAALGEAFSIMLSHTHIQSREMTPYLIAAAQLSAAAGRFEESRKTYETAGQMLLTTYGDQHLYTAQVMQGAAETALACGDLLSAREQIDRSMQLQRRFFGEQSQMLIDGWLIQARVQRACGAMGDSETALQNAIAAAQRGRNVVILARVYEQVNAIRGESSYTASAMQSL